MSANTNAVAREIVSVAEAGLVNGKLVPPMSPLQVQVKVAHAALKEAGLSLLGVDGSLTAGTWAYRESVRCRQ